MRRLIYSLALALAAPAMWLGLYRRARREGGEWGVCSAARFGRYAGAPRGNRPIWLHAVSLGETRAAKPLIDALLDTGQPLLLTHTTATGRAQSSAWYARELACGQLEIAWLPYDFRHAMRRFFAHFQPRAGILIEREVWPNLVAEAGRAGVPLALVSARLSARSLVTMTRLDWWMRPAFAALALVQAQTPADAGRLFDIGARTAGVMGNLKFDVALPAGVMAQGRHWRAAWRRPVVVMASTREGEEAAFLEAVDKASVTGSRPLFVLVPRHPQRFDVVARLLEAAGAAYVRRSTLAASAAIDETVDWLLGDSVGEMPAYYAAAEVAIIGGSFVDFGGHNLVEASAAGTPVLIGPHTRNFAQATEDALAEGAALRVANADAAIAQALQLLSDTPRRAHMAEAASRYIRAHQGATARALEALRPYLA